MGNNFDSEVLSDGTFHWWHGQIVDDSTWQENIKDKNDTKSDTPGWGYRYKVRILGQHTPDKKKLSDQNLPMAEVLLPVTAGSGLQGSRQTPNLSQGDFVVGFFKDGLKRTQPIILGSYSTGAQTKLYPGDPKDGFKPRTGYKGKSGDPKVHRKDQTISGVPREGLDQVQLIPANNLDKITDDAVETHLENNCEKKNSEMKGIQLTIKNLLKAVNAAKKAAQSAQNILGAFNAAAGPDFLTNELNKSTQLITQFVKNIMVRIRGYVTTKITNAIKDVTALVFPNKRQKLQEASEKGVNTFYCVMEKVLGKLGDLIKSLLKDLIDKFINAPLCAIEKFLGDLIGSLMNELINGITSALAPVIALIGSVGNQVSGIVNGVMNALNIASNILTFFSCDTEQLCPDYDTWTWGSGIKPMSPSPSESLGKVLDKLMPDVPGGDSPPPCNTSGIPCGPPRLEFMGQSLTSASGNLIVNSIGSIIGVDLTGSGSGYSSPPVAIVVDMCGIGKGAVLKTVFDPLLTGPDLTPITAGGDSGTPIYAGGTDGIPVTTPDGTPVTAGSTGGIPVIVNTSIVGGIGGIPVTTTDGLLLSVGGTDGVPVFAGGEGGIPIITSNGTSVTAGGNGGSSVTLSNGTPIVIETPLGGVISVEVIDSGFGYLSSPNGSVGGNGDVFANNVDGIYTAPNGNIDSYPPGTTITVTEGGTLGLPAGSIVEIYDNNSNLAQTIIGTGLLSPISIDFGGQIYSLYESLINGNLGNIPSQTPNNWLPLSQDFEVSESTPIWDETYAYNDGNVVRYNAVSNSGTLTIPEPGETNITVIGQSSNLSSGNTYPITLTLETVAIDDPGYSYDPSDNIFITPNNGSKLEVEYDKFGRVSKVNVIENGSGFTDIPEIGIISLTGYNANLRPVLLPRRIEKDEKLPEGVEIISVIDCVGKVK